MWDIEVPSGLRDLELKDIHFDFEDPDAREKCIDFIMDAIMRSPGLKTLTLSLAKASLRNWISNVQGDIPLELDFERRFAKIFMEVIDKYGNMGGPQLSLRTLNLGYGFLLMLPDCFDLNTPHIQRCYLAPDEAPDTIYLDKLVKLGDLEHLSWNNDFLDALSMDNSEGPILAWDAINKVNFPNLKSFSFTHMPWLASEFLSTKSDLADFGTKQKFLNSLELTVGDRDWIWASEASFEVSPWNNVAFQLPKIDLDYPRRLKPGFLQMFESDSR